MASLQLNRLRLVLNAFNCHKNELLSQKLRKIEFKVKYNLSSNENILHTIQVKTDIDKKRQSSLLGGGLERIESQHKKVCIDESRH